MRKSMAAQAKVLIVMSLVGEMRLKLREARNTVKATSLC